jgi:hypothetical protein
MNLSDIPIKPMTAEEIDEWINKCGGAVEYRKKVRASYKEVPEVSSAPKPVQKSAQVILHEAFEERAKYLGISIAKYYQEHPEDYQKVRQLGYSTDLNGLTRWD